MEAVLGFADSQSIANLVWALAMLDMGRAPFRDLWWQPQRACSI